MIKCIASDMDGTLLTGNSGISAKNKQAIKLAQEQGIQFIVATGRSYQEAHFALQRAEISCPVICNNGAEVRSIEGNIVSAQPLQMEKAKGIAAILVKQDVYFEVYTNLGTFTNNVEKAVSVMVDVFTSANYQFSKEDVEAVAKERIDTGFVQVVNDYEEILASPSYDIYKFLAFSPNGVKLSAARNELDEIGEIAISSSGDGNLEITSVHAQKGIALEKFVEQNGIGLVETMAIGDNDNDLSMLNIVGRSVAMGNAADHVKAQCHFVTATNDEDGVAEAIFDVLGLKQK
jgi:Cof subfamily protein (haloacid dehalogenase superfamily)